MSDEEINTDTHAVSATSNNKPKSKIRRWILGLSLFILICVLINGPLARLLVIYGVNKGLELQGMNGSAEVSGSLLKGISIHNLSYKGKEGIQSLEIDELSTSYHFTEIFSGSIRSLGLTNAKIIVDLDAFPATEKKEKSELKIRKTLTSLHRWISQPDITITHLDISIVKSDEKQAHFLLPSLKHQAASNKFFITGFSASDRQERTTPVQNICFIWEEESIQIDRFEAFPDLAVKDVKVDWSKEINGRGVLQFIQSQLQVIATPDNITAKLSNGNIECSKLTERFGLELPADFTLAGLNIDLMNWQQAIPQWNIHANIKLSSASYQDYKLSETSIQFKQKDHNYELETKGTLNGSPLTILTEGKWLSQDPEQWWQNTAANYLVELPRLGSLTKKLEGIPKKLELSSTAIHAKGEVTITDSQLTVATLKSQIKGIIADKTSILPLDIEARYLNNGESHAKLTASRNGASVLDLNASYHLNTQDYQASLTLKDTTPKWINALSSTMDTGITLDGPLDLTWNGHGNLQNFNDPKVKQKGQLSIAKLQIALPAQPTLDIQTEIKYHWPESLDVSSLKVREGEWLGSAKLLWNGEFIDITTIEIKEADKKLASISGQLPFHKDITSVKTFLKQKKDWDLTIKTNDITLNEIDGWLDINPLKKLTGITKLDVKLSGSPSKPEIQGSIVADNIKVTDDTRLSPLHTAWEFYTDSEKLYINGKLLEGNDPRLSFVSILPFTVSACLDDPNFPTQYINNAPISAKLQIDTLSLSRLKSFAPQLEKIEGSINGKATLAGTLAKPTYLVDLDADIPLIQVAKSDIGDIRKIKINTKLTQQKKINTQLTAQINGGKFEAGGTIDIDDLNTPVFDLYLRTNYALIHRDDMLSVRANSNLKLKGEIADATLSGSIGIVESLFYKDIELIPIGVPSSEVARVEMPALSKRKGTEELPIPKPFDSWKLDLTVKTDDPILIRGNVASGNLTCSIKVGGTLAKPEPLGTVLANQVNAKLPFSILKIPKGEITFTPENGLDPTLNIQGKSTVGNHDVSLFVYGSASNPKTTFTSYPPLPEADVMTLIATGTTTAGLENRSVATFKAFQIFLKKIQQRNDKPDGNQLFKKLLSGIDDLNLNVGETDPFTGRKFTSATVDIHPHWNLTAQVDDTQQTRGLIVYVIRFR